MKRYSFYVILYLACLGVAMVARAQENRKDEYVHAAVRGAAFMPWQVPGVSDDEAAFRAEIESRKDALLARASVVHPAFYDAATIARARENASRYDWAQTWVAGQVAFAEEIVLQPEGWIARMIPSEAPSHAYGFTCPVCVGVKSQEGVGDPIVVWDFRHPEEFHCRACGTVYPNERYPETAWLRLPRTGYEISYYLNPAEQATPDDRSGALAWHWVGYPIHDSFTGIIRERKINFMRDAVQILGVAYLFTEDARFAVTARNILVRLATCYRHWPYRDYWDTYADCDALYAAWHDKALPIEWKRHLSEQAYATDTVEKASMLQTYWGAGRIHPSTDNIGGLVGVIQAYDFTCDARDSAGNAVWDEAMRLLVERDLLLEWAMGAEPYIGGPGKADEDNNKSPRVYNALAALGKCLGIPEYVDVALRGYERVRDGSFLFDGFSAESPSYTGMYLDQLLIVPETLQGYTWPSSFSARSGTVNLYVQDPKLRLMYRSVLDTLLPDGRYVPLSDTRLPAKPSSDVLQMGVRRYPEYFHGVLPNIHEKASGEYAVFHLTGEELQENVPLALEEVYHPAWKTAILRSGSGTDAATLTLALNPPGGHRHADNLAIFYAEGARTIASDLGYLGDMPVNRWIRATASHNLVIVDGLEQDISRRQTELGFMATSPMASVVEASSTAYSQCAAYRRRVALVKVGDSQTFMIDLFSVEGGAEHRYRAISEIAASDAADGWLDFSGVSLSPEPPLPEVGTSLAESDIYGLRDVRSAAPSGEAWQAVWHQARAECRLWMNAPVDAVEAANAPGQRTHDESGRRVRVVDAVRRGEGLKSVFVSLRESRQDATDFPVQNVTRLDRSGGIALKIENRSAVYYALNDFKEAGEVDGIRFQGVFALVRRMPNGTDEILSVAAGVLEIDGRSVTQGAANWSSPVTSLSDSSFRAVQAAPDRWDFSPGVAQAYAKVRISGDWTAFPITSVEDSVVSVARFPMPAPDAMEIPSVVYEKIQK